MPRGRLVRTYIIGVITAGTVVVIDGAQVWNFAPLPFLCYVVLALFTSTLKVKLPGISGTFSANSVFTLLAIAQLGLTEAVLLSVGCSFVQSLWRASKPPLVIQVLFNAAVFAISCVATFWAYQFLIGWTAPSPRVIAFVAASCVFFLVNTFAVSGVIALVEHTPLLQVWRVWHLCSFPYYLVSLGLAALLMTSAPGVTLKAAAAVIPLVCALFFCYRLVSTYLQRAPQPLEIETY